MPPAMRCPHAEDGQAGHDRPPWEVADIFRLYGHTYRHTHGVSAAQQKGIDAIIACRTAALGGHAERCPQGGFERSAESACRHRHCPTGQTLTQGQWVEARRAEWLPTPYFHTVFPGPHALNALILSNKRLLLALLFRAARPTLLQGGQQTLGGQLGATMVWHTWDQTLPAHYHLHCLVPAGAVAENGLRWVPTQPRFLFPVQALRMVFRAKFLAACQQAIRQGARLLPQAGAPGAAPADFPSLLAQLSGQPWVVYAKRPCAGPAQVLDSLGRSIHRVAIANHRLRDVGDGYVRFTYRNRRQANQVQLMTLEAPECMRRLLLHVLPHGFQRMRHIGFLANRCKARPLPQCRHLLGQLPAPPPREQPSAAERRRQLTGLDITPCPHCGHAPLVRSPRPPGRPDTQGRGPLEVPHVDAS